MFISLYRDDENQSPQRDPAGQSEQTGLHGGGGLKETGAYVLETEAEERSCSDGQSEEHGVSWPLEHENILLSWTWSTWTCEEHVSSHVHSYLSFITFIFDSETWSPMEIKVTENQTIH